MHTNEFQVDSLRSVGDAVAGHPRLSVGCLPLLAIILLSGEVQSTARNVTYLDLHPEGASHSVLTSVTEDAQGGYMLIVADTPQPIPPSQTIPPEPDSGAQPVPLPESYAAFWSGSPESITLLAGGNYLSRVNDITPTHQVGQSASHAVMWSGSPESELHLFPGPIGSAYGIDGNRQVGMVGLPSSHAVMWEGSRDTMIDLHPEAARSSMAFGIRDGQQVGWIDWGNGSRATVWSGSAASARNLHPGPGWTHSVARATSGNLQAGSVWADGEPQAAIWRSTASSFKNLNPDGAESSAINDAMKHWQVGWARVDGTRQAMLWRGTAKSAISLHGVLAPDGYTNSVAHGLWTDGHIIKIAGSATTTNGSTHAILWIVTRPHPAVRPGRGEGRGQDRHEDHTPTLSSKQTPASTGSFDSNGVSPANLQSAQGVGPCIANYRD